MTFGAFLEAGHFNRLPLRFCRVRGSVEKYHSGGTGNPSSQAEIWPSARNILVPSTYFVPPGLVDAEKVGTWSDSSVIPRGSLLVSRESRGGAEFGEVLGIFEALRTDREVPPFDFSGTQVVGLGDASRIRGGCAADCFTRSSRIAVLVLGG